MTQSVQEQVRILSAIESEAHFLKVGLEMLRAEFMPTPAQTALEKRESVFNGVGMNVSAHILFFRVPDELVLILETRSLRHSLVGIQFIGEENIHIFSHVFLEKLFENAPSDFLGVKQSKFTIALPDSDDWTLSGAAPAMLKSVSLSADISFVHLDLSVEHRLVALGHCSTDAMAQVPSGLVAHSERPLNLTGGYALFCFTEQKRRSKPLFKRQMRVIENRSGCNGELIVTVLAVEKLFICVEPYDWPFASDTLRASGPAKTCEQFAAPLFGREHMLHIN
jgi:hypothetical protein